MLRFGSVDSGSVDSGFSGSGSGSLVPTHSCVYLIKMLQLFCAFQCKLYVVCVCLSVCYVSCVSCVCLVCSQPFAFIPLVVPRITSGLQGQQPLVHINQMGTASRPKFCV